MQFLVRGLSSANLIVNVRIQAESEQEARQAAEQQDCRPLSVQSIKDKRGSALQSRRFSLDLFCQELLALLNAGLTLTESLEALQEKEAENGTTSVIRSLLKSVQEGNKFSDALASKPAAFPALFIGLAKAAEGTSNLPYVLNRYQEYLQRSNALRNRIVSASIYPAILILVGIMVTLFLVGYVVPKFAVVYKGSGRNLPVLSRLMISWGQWAGSHLGLLATGIFVLLATMIIACREVIRTGAVGKLLQSLPFVGKYVRLYELSRLYMTLGMLLEGGIPVVSALVTMDAVVSPSLQQSVSKAELAIREGAPLSGAFDNYGLTTPISLRLLRVGEQAGHLGKMLGDAARFLDGEVSRFADRFTRAFEPALMLFIGLIVGLIVVLLYMPIFDLAGSIQ